MSKTRRAKPTNLVKKTSIDFPIELLERIDADAAANGRKRSDHIRFLLSKMVHQFPPPAVQP